MAMNIAAGMVLGILIGTLIGVAISLYRHRWLGRQRGGVSRVNDIVTGTTMALGALGGGLMATTF